MAVAAADIAPRAFNEGEAAADAAEEEDLQFDLRNLLVTNPHQVDTEQLDADKEAYLLQSAQTGVQALVARLFVLPQEPSDAGPLALLPHAQVSVLPRAKPVPKPKAETRWDKFAKEKGIAAGRKRDRMVWDEDHGEWRPRWGYKRAQEGVLGQPIVEVKPGQDDKADPWAEARSAKKARVEKNLNRREKNARAAGGTAPGGVPGLGVTPSRAGIPVDMGGAGVAPGAGDASGKGKGTVGGGGAGGMKRGKAGTSKALEMVQHSTASMGKFNHRRPAEPERRKKGARRQFKAVAGPVAEEAQSSLKILNAVMINKAKFKDKSGTAAASRDSLAAFDAVEGAPGAGAKRKKGRAGVGKMKKLTKGRANKKK